ncbi:hypothetical protein NMY22_g13691 [Coprinellus aureogranulatus]|nr:hypothetical protein NMY22_g13691 [Coprinellus aureogranulatus]
MTAYRCLPFFVELRASTVGPDMTSSTLTILGFYGDHRMGGIVHDHQKEAETLASQCAGFHGLSLPITIQLSESEAPSNVSLSVGMSNLLTERRSTRSCLHVGGIVERGGGAHPTRITMRAGRYTFICEHSCHLSSTGSPSGHWLLQAFVSLEAAAYLIEGPRNHAFLTFCDTSLEFLGHLAHRAGIVAPPPFSCAMKVSISFIVLSVSGLSIAAPLAEPEQMEIIGRALPTPVSAATARTYLASLTVEPENNSPAYNRDLFNHWITSPYNLNSNFHFGLSSDSLNSVSGSCNTRESWLAAAAFFSAVLKRDGTNVVTGSNCAATSGHWVSPYDGVATNLASDLDIDHLVPLKELVAVTDSLNQAKGDQDPAEWMVPLASYRCTYVRAWVQVKYYYNLSVDSAEKAALTNYLNAC